jgi:hypothetical protein
LKRFGLCRKTDEGFLPMHKRQVYVLERVLLLAVLVLSWKLGEYIAWVWFTR